MFSNVIAPGFIKQGESCLPVEIFTQIIIILQYNPQSQGPMDFSHTSIVNTIILLP